jgi:enamine deaminase RidA (YjgF/YER057c/UK114 family)
MSRKNISSGTEWEPYVGYSRAVRVGSTIYVSGTTATDEHGKLAGSGHPYHQTVRCLRNIENALEQLGAKMSDVVRTRMYVVDISQWKEIGRAHGEFFGEILPASTMVEVSGLVDPEMLVEIEAEAILMEP